MVIKALKEFFRLESASGILLFIAAMLAMVVENSAAKYLYDALLGTPVEIRVGRFEIAKPLLLWVNDFWMAIFFFLVGMEIKREWIEGYLADRSQLVLPAIAALGGIIVPGAVYASLNWGESGI